MQGTIDKPKEERESSYIHDKTYLESRKSREMLEAKDFYSFFLEKVTSSNKDDVFRKPSGKSQDQSLHLPRFFDWVAKAESRSINDNDNVSVDILEEIRDIVVEDQLSQALELALKLAKETIPGIDNIEVSLRQDLDIDEKEWIELTIYVTAEPKKILEAGNQLIGRWEDVAPSEVSDTFRFHYKFLR